MTIYQMTATFGKLQNETLTLQPGLNVIQAPNEWGKSTWCAFLMAMLFGLDTRAKTTKTALADKERFAPWSGAPMAGRIDLRWQGRDITIERQTKRRVPLGEFRAYETESGLPVPELTAANCGQRLLGVEKTVFRRAGFIRFSDLPVTQDDALRRRLNALVTTGDESGDADLLARDLRDLKNRCRYNRSGLLPQAEEKRRQLESALLEMEQLEAQCVRIREQLPQLEQQRAALENHRTALAYQAHSRDAYRLEQARQEKEQAEKALETLEKETASIPSRAQAEEKLRRLRSFIQQYGAARLERGNLPLPPRQPEAPRCFAAPDAEQTLETDVRQYRKLASGNDLGRYLAAAAGVLAAIGFGVLRWWLVMALAVGWAVLWLVLALVSKRSRTGQMRLLEEKYGSRETEKWQQAWQDWQNSLAEYRRRLAEHTALCGDLEQRLAHLETERASLCAGQSPEAVMELWQQVAEKWDALENAERETQSSRRNYENLKAVVRAVAAPEMPDELEYTAAQTLALLEENSRQRQQLDSRLWQQQGRKEALGSRESIEMELQKLNTRIEALEDTYAALVIAQNTLEKASQELQRRFAPRIAKRAQALMAQLTDGRYQRLSLGEDLSIQAGALQEETLHSALWRSDGTMDQLYLALRLAVAEELTPGIPLILDDALVRFDDTRLEKALKALKTQAQTRQVILFTCQKREQELLSD